MKLGSGSAALDYADFLWNDGRKNDAISILEEAAKNGLVSAKFWLALRLHLVGTDRSGYLKIEKLLREAEIAGHPAARPYLARLFIKGCMGVKRIPHGFWMLVGYVAGRVRRLKQERAEAFPA